ncbi:MAG: hypothetical protein KAJ44_00020 [Thermoplasmatales archaeon]|nr:hypothetical protein [Thermoplasmatales archaeon]
MYENVTSLDDIIKPEKYPKIKQEIDDFLRKVMEKCIGKIDTIVGVDRKGTWILHDFFHDNPDLAKFNIISDNQILPPLIKGLRILLFDNSVRSGATILRTVRDLKNHKPQSIKVACLLINDKAFDNINIKHQIEIEACKKFSTYEAQAKKYMDWEIIYLSGLRVKDNPDYPILKLTTSYTNLDKIYEYLVESFSRKIVNIYDDFIVDSIADTRHSLDISIEINSNDKSILVPYDSIITEIDGYKIRCFMACYDGNTEIKMVPLLNPRYDPSKCQIWKNSPDFCLYKLANTKKSEIICKICVPFLLNQKFLESIQTKVLPEIRKKGILIDNVELRSPEFRRFSRI